MATFVPQSGGLLEASLRPMLTEETTEAEGWPQLYLEPASWREDDQVWVLEVQPYDSFNVGENLEVMHQLASDGGEIAKQCPRQSEMPSSNPLAPVPQQEENLVANANPLAPVPQQEENLVANACETLCQQSTPVTSQNTCTKNQHICPHCGKAFQWPSDLAQHRCVHRGTTATKQTEHQSEEGPLVPVHMSLQEENTLVSPMSVSRSKSKLMTNQNTHSKNLHICDQCGKAYDRRSTLNRHQRSCHVVRAGKKRESQSEVSPLQEENSLVSPESKLETDLNTHSKNLHICDQCGKAYRWRCDLRRHSRTLHNIRAGKKSQSETSPLVSVSLQKENMFVSPDSTSKLKSKPTTGQSNHNKRQHICGKGYRTPTDRGRHQPVCYRRKAAEQRERRSEASSVIPTTLPLQAEKMFVAPESTFTPNLKPASDQSTHIKKQHICPHCGKGYRYPSDLARHQRVHYGRKATKQRECQSEADPLVHVPLPLEEENTFVSPVALFRPTSDPMTGQRTCTKNQHIGDQCERGCQKSCELVQHDQCHQSGVKTTRQGHCQSDSYRCSTLTPISWPLKTKNTFGDCSETVCQKLKVMTNQHTCTKHLLTCDQGRKGFQCPSELMHHDQYVHSGEKATIQSLHRCNHSGKRFQYPSGLAPCPFVRFGEQSTIQGPCQTEEPHPSPLASVPLQVKNVSANSPEIFSPMSVLMAEQNTHDMNQHICDQYQNSFLWPSEPAQHLYSGGNVAKCGQFCYSLQRAAHFSKMFYPNSQLVSDQRTHLHTCCQCGNACQWPPALDQHVHSGVELARQGHSQLADCSPNLAASIPLPLQEENTFTNSKQMGDQSIETQNLCICSHSGNGFLWPSELTQHPCVHLWRGVPRRHQCQSKVDDPQLSMSVTTPLQVSTFAKCQKAIHQNSKQMTDQCAHSKEPYLCDQSGESFQSPSDDTQNARTDSRERPYSCAICGSQFTRKVQLVKHQKLHKEMHDSDEEEEDWRHQGGCQEEVPGEDIPVEQPQWLPLQGDKEPCEPFASSKACMHDVYPTEESNSSKPPPPNSIWEIGASGQPYILSLGYTCECGNCEMCDSSNIDKQPTEPSSLGVDDTACSDLTSPESFCDTSTPMVLRSAGRIDESVEDMLKKKGSPASPVISRQARLPSAVASQYLEGTTSLSTKQDLSLMGEDKTYTCPKCLKQFSYVYNFKRHLVVHQKKKPYRCKKCGNCFAHESYLLKHQMRHKKSRSSVW